MSSNRLVYLPLGGAGEIGMNAYVYGYGPAGKERLILVDMGVTFPDMDSTPGVDLILPDLSWLENEAPMLLLEVSGETAEAATALCGVAVLLRPIII